MTSESSFIDMRHILDSASWLPQDKAPSDYTSMSSAATENRDF
jgi:hypothetical protein